MSSNRVGETVVVRWWWAPATVVVATSGGAAVLVLEALLGYAVRPGILGPLLLCHLVATAVVASAVSVFTVGRSTRRFADRSNPFWPGVGLGLLAALATGIAVGVLGVSSAEDLMSAIANSLLFAALTMEFPLMGLIGALAWARLTTRRAAASPRDRQAT